MEAIIEGNKVILTMSIAEAIRLATATGTSISKGITAEVYAKLNDIGFEPLVELKNSKDWRIVYE